MASTTVRAATSWPSATCTTNSVPEDTQRRRPLREDEVRPEQPRLLARAIREVVAADPPGETGDVADARARARLTAGDLSLEDDRVEPFRGRIDSRREAGGPGADDRDVVDVHTEARAAAQSLDEVAVRRVDEQATVVSNDRREP